MSPDQGLLRHFVGAIAYRTAKALRGAPPEFEAFAAGMQVRTPRQLVRHMSGVINYALGLVSGPRATLSDCNTYTGEVERLFALLRELSSELRERAELDERTMQRLLQGPLADAMTHAGQLALLRRLSGNPIPPENFFDATIDAERIGLEQADARSPDADWPEAPEGFRYASDRSQPDS